MMKTQAQEIIAEKEYKTISLKRERGYIEIGYYDGKVESFYESYPGMSEHYLNDYNHQEINSVINQLISCEWIII